MKKPWRAHLPRPRDRTQANAYERVHLDVAQEIGAQAFVTGNGGDNVFGYSQSAASLADHYLRAGSAGAQFDRCSTSVARPVAAFSMRSRRHGGWRGDRRAIASGRNHCSSIPPSWPSSRPRISSMNGSKRRRGASGKAAHISFVLRAQPTLEASRGYHLPVLSPLMSQPIIETCLEIPSWEWRAGGRDRSLARRAFARDLPPAILDRRVKGTPSRFAARLLDQFREPIRERLLGGRLASHRVIDAFALEKVLRGDGPVPDLERVRILELVNAEAWIDCWLRKTSTSSG